MAKERLFQYTGASQPPRDMGRVVCGEVGKPILLEQGVIIMSKANYQYHSEVLRTTQR